MRISVCIPTFNGAKYITEQLKSILNQLSDDDEIIISDNNSTDDTIDVIKNINDKRIKVYFCKPYVSFRKGKLKTMEIVAHNMENALIHATGDYIFFSDQDDIWLPNKVKVVLEHLVNADCIIHDCRIINDKKEIIFDSFFKFITPKTSLIGNFYKPSFMGCCMAFNRKILNKSLPFFKFPVEHDTWIGLCSLKFGKLKIINDKLILYRRHSGNVSYCVEGSKNSLWVKFLRRFFMLRAYVLRS